MITFFILGAALCIYWFIGFLWAYKVFGFFDDLFYESDKGPYITFLIAGFTFGGIGAIIYAIWWLVSNGLAAMGEYIYKFINQIVNKF
jgi:hypothetical protein